MARRITYTNPHQYRGNKGGANSRLSRYPTAWIESAADLATTDETDTATAWIAKRGEDFDVTRAHFITDLHRIARVATQRAHIDQDEGGYIVRTRTRGLPEDEVEFRFFRVPIAETPLPDTAVRAPRGAAEDVDTDLLEAYERHRQNSWFCPDVSDGGPMHVRGYGNGCETCTGTTAQILPETPDAAFVASYHAEHGSTP